MGSEAESPIAGPRRVVLDTQIYDMIVAVPGLPERLAHLRAAGSLVILQTHVERDELDAIPDEQKKAAVLAVPVTAMHTSGAVWGVSKWDQATWGGGSGDVKIDDVRSEAANHLRDALIASTAAASADSLVTEDKRLANRVRAASAFPVWDFAQFLAFVESLESNRDLRNEA